LKLPLNLPLRKMVVIGSASANFKNMWSLKPTNKKPIEVKQIVFDNVAGIFYYPKNIRIPNVGEYVWFDVWKQGTVLSVENKLEDGFFVTTIRCGEVK
jgi:phosphoribosylformylglycinamidine (FGAM) synthase-like enzyme